MSRSRWFKRALAGVLAVSAAGGCKQQLFMEPGDYTEAVKVALPRTLDTDPHAPITPGQVDRQAQINTVIDFARPARNMTLRECIAIALEQGNVGSQSPQQFGIKNDGNFQFNGRTLGGTDAVRAFAVDPAIAQTEIERSLSRFDARWVTTMQWQKIDQPVAAQFLSFQQSRDAASFSSTLAKPLPTGGVVGITTSMDYSKFGQQATQQTQLVNPNYTPRVQLSIEQPLLRLFGVEINQIAGTGPLVEGSQTLQGVRPAGGLGTEGILITRIRLDQAKSQFDQQINFLLVNVEAAYWNLYAAYYNLYAQEEGLRQAFEGYRFTDARVNIGTAPPQLRDQIQAQFHRFQAQVYEARGQVLESERQLRGFLGLRSDDGTRIVPIDEPNLAPYKPDFHEAANDAIAMRPELMLARQELKFRQLDLLLQKNLRRPNLTSFATYDVAGLGTRLGGASANATAQGNQPGNALGSLADNRFNSWTLGFRFDVPLGFRDANALVRASQLNMTRSYIQLRDAELKAIEYLSFQYRRVIQAHAVIAPRRAEREALQQYVYRIRRLQDIRGAGEDFLSNLTVQQQLAAAIAAEARAVADYNTALSSFEFAKGTIQQYNNVSIGEGPLPPWVQKRAADHIRERTEAALKLRELPTPTGTSAAGGHPIAPAGGTNSLPALPPWAEKREPVPEALPPRGMPAPMPQPAPAPRPGELGGATRPVFSGPSAAVGRTDVPDDVFTPGGRATIPQPPPPAAGGLVPATPPAPPAGVAGAPEEFFTPSGRATMPPPAPRRPGEPVWGPPGVPAAPLPPVATAPPVEPAPVVPPTLPPLPVAPGQ
jgi:outer membrane protein TolC